MEDNKTRVEKIVVGVLNDSAQIPNGWSSSETVTVGQGNSIRGDIINDPVDVNVKIGTPDRQGNQTTIRYNEEPFIKSVADSSYLNSLVDLNFDDSSESQLTLFGKFSPLVWDSGGTEYGGADYRIITGYQPDPEIDEIISVRDANYVLDSDGNAKFRLRLADFSPVFIDGEEYAVQFLNFDDLATGFTVTVENPEDFKSRYITEVVAMSVARISASNYPNADPPSYPFGPTFFDGEIYNKDNAVNNARFPDMPATNKPLTSFGTINYQESGMFGGGPDYFGEFLPNLFPLEYVGGNDYAEPENYKADSDLSEEHRFRINQFQTDGPKLDSAGGAPVNPSEGWVGRWTQTFNVTDTAFIRTNEAGAFANADVGDEYDDSASTNGFLYTDGQYGNWGGPILNENDYDGNRLTNRSNFRSISGGYPYPPFNRYSSNNLYNSTFGNSAYQNENTNQGSQSFPDRLYALNYSRPFKLVLKDNTGAVYSTKPFMFAWKQAFIWNTVTPCLGKTFLQTYESTTYEVGLANVTNLNNFQGDAHSPHQQIRDSANDFYATRICDGPGNNPQPVTPGQITFAMGEIGGYLYGDSAAPQPGERYFGNNYTVGNGEYIFDSVGPEYVQLNPYDNVKNSWSYFLKEQWVPGFERWPDQYTSAGTLSNTHNFGTGTWTFAVPLHHTDRGDYNVNGEPVYNDRYGPSLERRLMHWGLLTRPAGIDAGPYIIAGNPPAPPGGPLPPEAPNWVTGVTPVGYTRSRNVLIFGGNFQTYVQPAMEAAGTFEWDPENGFDFLGASYKNRLYSSYNLSGLISEFLYPSFWLFSSGDLTTPTNDDIVLVDEYKPEVTSLGHQSNSFSGYVNNLAAGPQAFWFGIRKLDDKELPLPQPTSFRTGSSPSLLSDVSVVTRVVNLSANPPPNLLYLPEPFNLYGFVLQPGTTYVSIGP